MHLNNGSIILSYDDLVGEGLLSEPILKALIRRNQIEQIQRGGNGRQALYAYESLPLRYKQLLINKLGMEPLAYLQQHAEKAAAQKFTVQTQAEDLAFFVHQEQFTSQQCQRYARSTAWFRLALQHNEQTVRLAGYKNTKAYKKQIFEAVQAEQAQGLVLFKKGKITDFRTFEKNLVQFQQEGINALLPKYYGNGNSKKIDTLVQAFLIKLAADPRKLSFEDVAEKYNNYVQAHPEKKLPLLTLSAIKMHLYQPAVRRIWYTQRHGSKAAAEALQPMIKRLRPSRPDALWSMDGTTLQLYYQDESGKIASGVYMYLVFDVYSGAIIGSALGKSENTHIVNTSLKAALQYGHYLPAQLQYDNSGPNMSAAVSGLIANMSTLASFPCQPYRPRGKYAESLIGQFEQNILRQLPNFKGGNITAKSINSRANEAFLKQQAQAGLLPNYQQLCADFAVAVNNWNTQGKSRNKLGQHQGERRISMYQQAHPDRKRISNLAVMGLFMVELPKKYTYRTEGIRIIIDKQLHHFYVPDVDGVGDHNFQRKYLNKEFTIKLDAAHLDYIKLFIGDVFVADAFEKKTYSAALADRRAGEGAELRQLFAKNNAIISQAKATLIAQEQLLQDHGIEIGFDFERDKTSQNAFLQNQQDQWIENKKPAKRELTYIEQLCMS